MTEGMDGDRSAWLRCYRCWARDLEVQLHYDAILRIDPETGEPADRLDEVSDAVVQCLRCLHDQPQVENCSGEGASESLTYGSLGEPGTREFFTHVRFHKHDDERIVVHLLVELYARSSEEATQVLEEAARGMLTLTSLAEESRPPAATAGPGDH